MLIDWNHFANIETPDSLLEKLSEQGWITRPSAVKVGEFHPEAIAFVREIEKRFYSSYPDSTEEIRALPVAKLSHFEEGELAALVMWAKRANDQLHG